MTKILLAEDDDSMRTFLASALRRAGHDVQDYADGETALQWLVHEPAAPAARATWKGPYLDGQIPVDPWNNPYKIITPGPNGKPFAVISYGADGRQGGEGLDADITAK